MKVAIFGGSFNPIQNAHLNMAKYLLNQGITDEVWTMPCKVHPLHKNVIDEKHRVEMINLAIRDIANIKLCDIELKKPTTSYTYQTLRELKSTYPHEFYLIAGADILLQMEKWHGREHLMKEAKFIIFSRPNYSIKNPGLNIEKIIYDLTEDVSSTEVRKRILDGKSISELVPLSVEDYIKNNHLYQNEIL